METEIRQGLIVKALGGFYYVQTSKRLYECRAKGAFRKQGISPVCGDHVEIEVQGDHTATVSGILPRRNDFVRPPMANIEQMCFVVSMDAPPPNLQVLDTLIAISEKKKMQPVILLTKCDLQDPLWMEQIYKQAGFSVCTLSTQMPAQWQTVHALLQGKISALVGNTGAGKSTLLNHLMPDLLLQTGEISQKLGRGRHTTRHVALYPLPQGGYVADTPGFSSVDLLRYGRISAQELPELFREFALYTSQCRFTGCSHTVEKGCAVLEAVESGQIAQSRHQSYCAMYETAKQVKEWEYR